MFVIYFKWDNTVHSVIVKDGIESKLFCDVLKNRGVKEIVAKDKDGKLHYTQFMYKKWSNSIIKKHVYVFAARKPISIEEWNKLEEAPVVKATEEKGEDS